MASAPPGGAWTGTATRSSSWRSPILPESCVATGATYLPGAAPRALGRPLSIVSGAEPAEAPADRHWSWLAEPGVPAPVWLDGGLPTMALPDPAPAPAEIGLVRDASIALVRMRGGTDQVDFVFEGDDGQPRRPTVPRYGVVVVPGDLWLSDPAGVLTIELAESLTLVVDGNIYIDASIRVLGGGQLVLVARTVPGSRFVDADLDGLCSRAEVPSDGPAYTGYREGSGFVHFGVPGDETGTPIACDASIVAHGPMVVRRSRVDLHGAILLGDGLCRTSDGCRVRFTGRRVPDVHRRRVPGFAVRGLPRPGLLRPTDGRSFSRLTPSIPEGGR